MLASYAFNFTLYAYVCPNQLIMAYPILPFFLGRLRDAYSTTLPLLAESHHSTSSQQPRVTLSTKSEYDLTPCFINGVGYDSLKTS